MISLWGALTPLVFSSTCDQQHVCVCRAAITDWSGALCPEVPCCHGCPAARHTGAHLQILPHHHGVRSLRQSTMAISV